MGLPSAVGKKARGLPRFQPGMESRWVGAAPLFGVAWVTLLAPASGLVPPRRLEPISGRALINQEFSVMVLGSFALPFIERVDPGERRR